MDIYAIIVGTISILSIVLFYYNFISVLNFKYYFDYYTAIDISCNSESGNKLEIETLRYNLYKFFFNLNKKTSENYKNISSDYNTSFKLFLGIYTICVVIIMFFQVDLPKYMYVFIGIILITYTTVNGIIVQNFSNISNEVSDELKVLRKYRNVYTILNAMLKIGNIDDEIVEYSNSNFNFAPKTFAQIIKSNITSYIYSHNTSEINQEYTVAIENLDVAKYLIFDRTSSFYLKYFDNMYLRIKNDSIYNNIYEVAFIKEIDRYDTEDVIKKVKQEIDKISVLCPTECPKIFLIGDTNTKIKAILNFLQIAEKEANVAKTIDNLEKITNLKNILANINKLILPYKLKYLINNEVKPYMEDKAIIVPDDDYVKYFIDNMDILTNTKKETEQRYEDLLNLIRYQSEFIYAYVVFWVILLLIILHGIFIYINSFTYILLMIAMIFLPLVGIYFKGSKTI